MSSKPVPTLYGDRKVYSVASFVGGVAGWIERLPAVWVEGEIAELRRSPRWGTVWFTLKDAGGEAMVAACMARSTFDRVEPRPKQGDRVQALGRPQIFRQRGEFQLRVTALELFGLGLLLRQIEALRGRLAAEGLFAHERKRPLPFLPRRIGLVCGSDAAARRDVVETAQRRYPPARFRIVEAAVQGPRAAAEIAAAVARLDRDASVDVIVVARGGGSFEDLLPFSDERVCRAAAACTTPVVSAIGHEQDAPLLDLVADARAGTPSLAAKMVVPDYDAALASLDALLARAARALEGTTERSRRSLEALASRPAFASPRSWLETRQAALALLRAELGRQPRLRLERERARLDGARDRLRLLGPAATLERGYAVVQDGSGAVVRDAEGVAAGDPIRVLLGRGRLAARVEEVEP